MRRKSRASAKQEKTVMILSSVFVLAALTVTGLFIKGKSEEKNDGYVVDFSAIENETDGQARTEPAKQEAAGKGGAVQDRLSPEAVTADDLDYDPSYQEANSPKVKNPDTKAAGTDTAGKSAEKTEENVEGMFDETIDTAKLEKMKEMEDTMAIATSIQPTLTFGDSDSLSWPIVGNILINYSMDKTVYFPTLQQYKYNPAIIISAAEGETITAASAGKVISVSSDPELGNLVVMELGGGYEITYGQLKDITVSEGGYVNKGDIIGSVAAPTKYYIVEGTNVYFKLTKDGIPVNPMTKLK